MSDINVTYEVLFEIMLNEKKSTEMQKLPDSFYNLVVEYIKEKQDLLKKDDDIFSANVKKQVILLLDNVERILTEIYTRREKKIIDMAILKSKVKSSLVDTSNMQEAEQYLFEKVLTDIDHYRMSILNSVLNTKLVEVEHRKVVRSDDSLVTVRFLEDIGKFFDSDLKEYGPYEKETLTTLPFELAKPLLENNKLEILDDV